MEDQTRMNGKTLLSVAFMGKPTVSSALPNQMKLRVGLSRAGWELPSQCPVKNDAYRLGKIAAFHPTDPIKLVFFDQKTRHSPEILYIGGIATQKMARSALSIAA
ncbi:MAG: hypothetical protein AAF171_15075 [Cyanobacteria bacterium P01_A01_bin.116]